LPVNLIAVERLGLGLDYLDKYRKAVAAVTPEDVQEVAKKHIDPDRLILTAAGAVSADGKVIGKEPGGQRLTIRLFSAASGRAWPGPWPRSRRLAAKQLSLIVGQTT